MQLRYHKSLLFAISELWAFWDSDFIFSFSPKTLRRSNISTVILQQLHSYVYILILYLICWTQSRIYKTHCMVVWVSVLLFSNTFIIHARIFQFSVYLLRKTKSLAKEVLRLKYSFDRDVLYKLKIYTSNSFCCHFPDAYNLNTSFQRTCLWGEAEASWFYRRKDRGGI